MNINKIAKKIIVALDAVDVTDAVEIINELKGFIDIFKIGQGFINRYGAEESIKFIHNLDKEVFFDQKIGDIPMQVGEAVNAVSWLSPYIISVQALSGKNAMKSAVKNKHKSKIFAVTLLTSFSENDCVRIFNRSRIEQVKILIEEAKKANVDGIICSGRDLEILNEQCPECLGNLLKIIPGIRPTWFPHKDQKMTITPKKAFELGADYIVIGRPITDCLINEDYLERLMKILKEISDLEVKD